MEFDLAMLLKIVAYAVAIVAIVVGLRFRTDALEKGKVDKLDCVGHHGELATSLAEIRAEMRVVRGGIKVMFESGKKAGTFENPPRLPDEFYEDDE